MALLGTESATQSVGETATPTRTSYYYLGSRRVALRQGAVGQAGTVYWLHTDHLGSTSLTTNASGGLVAQARYLPFGGTRWTSGALRTDYLFTGQKQEANIGLYDYGARFYDPLLGRFLSADSIVPGAGNPQALNRFAYALSNPVKYTDPSGHCPAKDDECLELEQQTSQQYGITINGLSKAQISMLQDMLGAMSGNTRSQVLSMLRGVVGSEQAALQLLRQSKVLATAVVLNNRQASVLATNGFGIIGFGGEIRGADTELSSALSNFAIGLDALDGAVTGAFAIAGFFAPVPVLAAYRQIANVPLTIADLFATGSTMASDWFAGRTSGSFENGRVKVYVGFDTLVSINSTVWGGLNSKDPWTGSLFDGLQVTWDAFRLSGVIPGLSFFIEYIP